MHRNMLDLCSGTGGASQAFFENPNWDVMRIDNNPLVSMSDSQYYVPGTYHMDLLETYPEDIAVDFDFIWASPTCTGFSNAYSAPMPTARREKKEYEPDMTLVQKCLDIIRWQNPKYWVIENVSGSSKYISKLLGRPPRQIIGPFFLWGNFPFISLSRDFEHRKADLKLSTDHPLFTTIKARIPYEISEAFLDAHENQMTLEDFL